MLTQFSTAVLGLTGLLALAVLIVPTAKRLQIPHTVLLALTGCILGGIELLLPDQPGMGILGDFLVSLKNFQLTSEMIFFLFLPALVFQAALSINTHRLAEDLLPILILAIVGLLLSTSLIGFSMWGITSMGLVVCLLLGAILSATDPVAVVAIFHEIQAPKRLMILVEGESLFNDATAIVMFTLLGGIILQGIEPTWISGVGSFLKIFLGGIVTGYLCGHLVCMLFQYVGKHSIVKITLTISLAYLSFILAEHYLHVSGVMAAVSAGLVISSVGRSIVLPSTWASMKDTWGHIGFWANSIIFVLVGLVIPSIILEMTRSDFILLITLIAAAFLGRGVIIYGLLPLVTVRNWSTRVSTAFKTVMFWGGLRGAVSLALAFSIMENPAYDAEVRHFIGTLVTSFVLFTLFVNATTIGRVMRFFGLHQLSPTDQSIRHRAMEISLHDVSSKIETAAEDLLLSDTITHKVIRNYQDRAQDAQAEREKLKGISRGAAQQIGLMDITHQERASYIRNFGDGVVGTHVARLLQTQTEDLIDGIRSGGTAGYEAVWMRKLEFDWRFRLGLTLFDRFGYSNLLARLLADRFEVLLFQCRTLQATMRWIVPEISSFMGTDIGEQLLPLLRRRLEATTKALAMLKLHYPQYAQTLEKRYLSRMALRMEGVRFRELIDESLISEEVFRDLERELDASAKELEKRPRLDLGLDAEGLLARVPFFSDLSEHQIQTIAAMLHPRLTLPGETIIRKGTRGVAMFFIASGCAEIQLAPDPVHLGSGDFFGEIALLEEQPRIADVISYGFSNLLVLKAKDFQAFLNTQPELRKTLCNVAQERLQQSGTV